jgi:hypothetical protein
VCTTDEPAEPADRGQIVAGAAGQFVHRRAAGAYLGRAGAGRRQGDDLVVVRKPANQQPELMLGATAGKGVDDVQHPHRRTPSCPRWSFIFALPVASSAFALTTPAKWTVPEGDCKLQSQMSCLT